MQSRNKKRQQTQSVRSMRASAIIMHYIHSLFKGKSIKRDCLSLRVGRKGEYLLLQRSPQAYLARPITCGAIRANLK